jgi:uncharacterized protein DUF2695
MAVVDRRRYRTVNEMSPDEELVNSIAADVMTALTAQHFFQFLDDAICPLASEQPAAACDGTHRITTAILNNHGFDSDDISDVIAVLKSKGGCCDCEVLYNAAPESRLRSKYWTSRAAHIHSDNSD